MFKALVVKANDLEDERCAVCIYRDECKGCVTSGSNGEPIFPPCAGENFYDFIDENEAMEYF